MYIKRILLVIALAGLILAGAFSFMVYSTFFSPNTNIDKKEVFVFIPTNSGFEEVKAIIGPHLKNIGSFETAARRKRYTESVKPGKYAIAKGMNNNSIVNSLRSRNLPVRVAFNNQENIYGLAGRIATQIEADSNSLVLAFGDPEFLKQNSLNEHTLMAPYIPNSYEFFWNTGAEEFRDRMLTEYRRFWNEHRLKKAGEKELTPLQVISLASIVHKETAKVDERPKVAGVYLNRLRLRMPLQADPTVIFAIKKHFGNFDTIIKRVLYKDLELDSPYNTYKYTGIPPGPITMPDITAIDGVLNAETHDYLYFVADIENFGYHKFASSLAQHNRNKLPYIRWINSQKIKR